MVKDNGTRSGRTKVVVGKPHDADAAAHRDDEVHHRQSDLERAAVDHPQRISAGAAAGSDRARAHGPRRSRSNRDGSVHIYQPPGERNALGRIRFNFPNKFLVYQHDTPDKHLFAHDKRAYSHGCMRVQDPASTAKCCCRSAMPDEGFTAEAAFEHVRPDGNRHQVPDPADPGPLTYQTAFVDDAGKLVIREDIYGFDARIHRRR